MPNTTPDFRALCAELLEQLGQDWDDEISAPLAERAKAALAAEPQGPTDEELIQVCFDDHRAAIEFICSLEEEAELMIQSHVRYARAVLARWGAQP